MAFNNFEENNALMSDINMTPLVDVMLVLLIMFIITIPVINDTVRVELPKASNVKDIPKPDNIQLSINSQGQLYWDKEPISHNLWLSRVRTVAQKRPLPELHIRADRNVRYEYVAQVMADAQKGGLNKIGFIIDPQQQ